MRRGAHSVLFYSHNGVGVGHFQRQLRLAVAYRERRPDSAVLLATGSHAVDRFGTARGVDYLKLPSIRMVDRYETWEPRELDLPIARLMRLRAELLRDAVRQLRPDLLVADFLPAGPYGELLPALEELAACGGHAVAGFRDIIDEPSFVRALWRKTGVYDVLLDHYDAVCVYGTRDVMDFEAQYALRGELAARLRYVGYLCSPTAPGAPSPADSPFVIATTGGGVDGGPLLSAFIAAAGRLLPEVGGRWLVVAGPLLSEDEYRALRKQASPAGVEVRRFVSELARRIAQADVVVTMPGYNASCELLSSQARAVVVPRAGPSLEQRMRAVQLVRWQRARALEPGALDTAKLANAIREALVAPPPPPSPVPLAGVERALDLFQSVAGEVSSPVPRH